MTVIVYRWDDPSAPVLSSPSAGSLIGVLDACLVNGYGSKAAAGWTKAFSGTNLAAYRQGGGSMCYLRVNDGTGTGQARAIGYEAMTDISTGTNPFPTEAQLAGGGYININATASALNKPWVLVADDRRFYLWTGYATAMTSASVLSASATYQGVFFFGDIMSYKVGDSYGCQIICAASSAASSERFGAGAAVGTVVTGHFIARNAAQTAGSVPNGALNDYFGANSNSTFGESGGTAYPDPVSGGINLSRIRVSNGATTVAIRGHLPGAWAPASSLPGSNGDTFSGAGALAGRTFILLDCGSTSVRGRVAIETSNTWD